MGKLLGNLNVNVPQFQEEACRFFFFPLIGTLGGVKAVYSLSGGSEGQVARRLEKLRQDVEDLLCNEPWIFATDRKVQRRHDDL